MKAIALSLVAVVALAAFAGLSFRLFADLARLEEILAEIPDELTAVQDEIRRIQALAVELDELQEWQARVGRGGIPGLDEPILALVEIASHEDVRMTLEAHEVESAEAGVARIEISSEGCSASQIGEFLYRAESSSDLTVLSRIRVQRSSSVRSTWDLEAESLMPRP